MALRHTLCWLALLGLTALTFGLSHLNLGLWSLGVALAIAVTKAAVVVLFFMQLWDYPGAHRLVFVVSVFFVLVLNVIVLADVATRFPLARP